MRAMRSLLLALTLLAAGCLPPAQALERAQHRLDTKQYPAARDEFDKVAASRKATPKERAQALTGAALACKHLGLTDAARLRLEKAIAPEVPGGSEVAFFELAELEHLRDRARALSLYYRAAAGAQKNLGSGYPYHEASTRIIQLSNSR
jgi:hypothetical protein